jgi:hypothetical protein
MPDLKQQLTELIDAYATAKATGNQLLTQSAATGLIQFLDGVEVSRPEPQSEAEPVTEEADGGEG